MFRKAVIGLFAVALATVTPTLASARAGGGHHGGGHHGGFHGGGFHHHGGFPRAGIAAGAIGLGLGLATAPFAYGGGPYYGSYGYYGGGCYLAPQRVWTPYGWRVRRVEVCD
jgi:hypothetical protein